MFQKMNLLSLLSVSFICAGSPALAKIQEFKLKDEAVKLDLPVDWQNLNDFLGVPLTLMSPKGTSGNRTVIHVTPYGVTDKDDLLKKIPKDPEAYVKLKEDWLEELGGQSLSYDSFHEESTNGSTVYSIGMSYEVDGDKFHEQTFFVSDKNKRIYFISALSPLDQDNQTQNTVKAVARSIASAK